MNIHEGTKIYGFVVSLHLNLSIVWHVPTMVDHA